MLDRRIPFYNVIMKRETPVLFSARIPEGYAIRPYKPGDEREWAKMECAVKDFDSEPEALSYFERMYLKNPAELKARMIVAADGEDRAVGACIAWRDRRGDTMVPSLHWLIVSEAHSRRGLGGALVSKTLEIFDALDAAPVYIHTQPWSHVAIRLYARFGFRLQKTDTFSDYENQYEPAIKALKRILPAEEFRLLVHSAQE